MTKTATRHNVRPEKGNTVALRGFGRGALPQRDAAPCPSTASHAPAGAGALLLPQRAHGSCFPKNFPIGRGTKAVPRFCARRRLLKQHGAVQLNYTPGKEPPPLFVYFEASSHHFT